MLFLYIAEVIPKVCAGLGLELGLSGYALLEAVFIGCALSPAAGLPLYCWYFFRRGLGSNPVYPALFYLAQSFASILGLSLIHIYPSSAAIKNGFCPYKRDKSRSFCGTTHLDA